MNSNRKDSQSNKSYWVKQKSSKFQWNKMLNELFYEVVPVILKHDDMNSMYYSIENRSPYLDHNLVEFMYKVPTKYLIKNSYQKRILRDTSKNILNEEIRLNRRKYGFN